MGTDRPLVAARVDLQVVVAPDNGLLHFLWSRGQDRMAVRVDTSGFDPKEVSATFHGRDIIAPLAARLASGQIRFEDLGSRIPTPHLVSDFLPRGDSGGTTTRVLLSDRFGNVILTVARAPWYAPVPSSATLESGRVVDTVVQTYGEIEGDFAMLWNSAGHLEIAGNRMSAAATLNLQVGDRVRVAWATPTGVGPQLSRRHVRRPMTSPAMASGEQARALDLAAAGLGVSNDALMALASFQCARLARRLLREQGQERPRPLAVLAGRGNNGADALGCARHLAAWGHPVRAVTLADPTHRGDVYSNQLRAALASGVEVREATDDLGAAIRWTLEGAALAVDGLLGTGTTGPARGAVAAAIAAVNLGGVRVMAIDVPSGLDATTGERPGECLGRRHTDAGDRQVRVLAAQASAWVGRPWLADIGVPAGAYAAAGLRRPWLEAGDLVPLDSGRGPAG